MGNSLGANWLDRNVEAKIDNLIDQNDSTLTNNQGWT